MGKWRRDRKVWELWSLGLYQQHDFGMNELEIKQNGVPLDHTLYERIRVLADEKTHKFNRYIYFHLFVWCRSGIYGAAMPPSYIELRDGNLYVRRADFKFLMRNPHDTRGVDREDQAAYNRLRKSGLAYGDWNVDVAAKPENCRIQDEAGPVVRRKKRKPGTRPETSLLRETKG